MSQTNQLAAVTTGDALSPERRTGRAIEAAMATRDEALWFERWRAADINLEERISALRMWTGSVHATAARVGRDWCISSLDEILDQVSQLRVLVRNARTSRCIREDSPLVQYLADVYVWTGEALADVYALVQRLEGAPAAEGGGSLADSSAYIADYLAPLHRQIVARYPTLGVDPVLRRLQSMTALLESAIVALDWGLRADETSAAGNA
jgi:hypothetical protein